MQKLYQRTPTNLGKLKHCKEIIGLGNFSLTKSKRRIKKGQLLKNSKDFHRAILFYEQNNGGLGQNDPPHGCPRVKDLDNCCYYSNKSIENFRMGEKIAKISKFAKFI